jgi:hypothetical protein
VHDLTDQEAARLLRGGHAVMRATIHASLLHARRRFTKMGYIQWGIYNSAKAGHKIEILARSALTLSGPIQCDGENFP